MSNFEKTCDYLDWRHIAHSVLHVFLENEANESDYSRRIRASSDQWGLSSHLRDDVWRRSRKEWCRVTGLDETWFPYSVDGAVRLYMRFRKRNPQEIAQFKAEIDGYQLENASG